MPASIVGRETELEAVAGFLEARERGPAALVFEGEAGIGKTTLWREAVALAEAREFRVLRTRPSEPDRSLSFAGLADLLDGIEEDRLGQLPPPQRMALDGALLRGGEGTSPDPRAVFAGLLSILKALATRTPVLVAVDDVQWLDPPSGCALQFAARRLGAQRIGLLLALRLPGHDADALLSGLDDARTTRLRVGPFTLAATHQLLSDRLERAFPRPTLLRIQQASGGNPFFALEIARELERTNTAVGTPIPVPDDLRTLLSRRVRRLPADTREALLAASALSHPTTAVLDERSLVAAEEAELVRIDDEGRIAFRHPLYASAIYEAASHTRRRELHNRLASLVTEPEERARHLAVATVEPDESVAAILEEGAARARSRGAWWSGAELLERARDLTPPERIDDVRRRGISAAEHHVLAGDGPRAREILEEILAEPLQGSLRADALRWLAELSNDGDSAERKRLLAEALEYADDPRLAVEIEFSLAYVNTYHWAPSLGALHAHRALELAPATKDGAMFAVALAHSALFDFQCGQGVDWGKVERSLALEDNDRWMPLHWRPSTIAGLLLLDVDRLSEARERLTTARNAALERGDEVALAYLLAVLSGLETKIGDFGAAAALAEEAVSLGALGQSGPNMQAIALANRALVHAHRGQIAETRRDCAEATARHTSFSSVTPGVLIPASLGLLEISLGNPEEAWYVCKPHTEALERRGLGEPSLAPFLPLAIEALVALGELERAERLTGILALRGRELDRPWALAASWRCRALLFAARGELEAAVGAIEQAIVEHERLPMPFELGRTLLVRGQVERRWKKKAAAKESLERALAVFDGIGARLWAERARVELDRVGLRHAAPDELTETERRVADLASSGLTNREVAAQLFLSPKTVEANLARVYRKLDIHSRAELGARLAGAKHVPAQT